MNTERDIFISYTAADRAWAEWLAWELNAAGYTTLLQAWDMPPGTAFVHEMHQAAQKTRHTMLVLSPAYLRSAMAEAEWRPGLIADPSGTQRRLLPVRVEDCKPTGLLADRVYVDLVGLDEATTQATLLDGVARAVRGPGPPTTRPRFPRAPVAAVDRPRFPSALPPVWNVPYRRNPAFTGREQLLADLAGRLSRGAAAVTQALQGGGGVGKTALAVEYAYRHRAEFDAVWWVRAEEPATLVGDLADLAVALRLAGAGQADQHLAVLAVCRWLDGHDRWLLVLDNAQAPDAATGLDAPLARLVDLLPQVLHGQVLVTSRDASWEEHAALAELEVFTPEEAVAFLLVRALHGDPATAAKIAELLGQLPLALEQAGAYVRETRMPLATYLDRLRQFPDLIVAKGRPRDRDPADTVATTWQISLERVRPTPGAWELLEVCAFLGPEEVPRDLFARQLDPVPEELAVLAGDPFALDEAVAGLRRFGLVKADEQGLIVHRLMQQVVRDHLEPRTAAARAGVAVRLLAEAMPFGGSADPGLWPVCARLLPHALVVSAYGQHLEVEPLATANLLESTASYLQGRARFAEARALRERALSIREARLGADHPTTAQSLNDLANVLHGQGDLDGARALHQHALAVRKARLGTDHTATATSLNNLANVLRDQGDLDGAHALHQHALAIFEARLGADHPDTANSLNNLALVLADQGDLDAARALHQHALAISEARLGTDHTATATSLNNLANVLRDQGDLDAARPLVERALAIREARLGADHPHTAQSLTNLAALLYDRGDLDGARPLYERALAIYEARLGLDHPDTVRSRQALAVVIIELEQHS